MPAAHTAAQTALPAPTLASIPGVPAAQPDAFLPAGVGENAGDIARDAGAAADRAIQAAGGLIEQLPFEAHLVAIAGLLAGALLWLYGRSVVRLAVGLASAVVFGLLGVLVLPNLAGPSIAGLQTSWLGMAVGAALGLALGLAVLKFVIVAASGATFAVLGLMAAIVYVDLKQANADADAPPAPADAIAAIDPADIPGTPIDQVDRPDPLRDTARRILDDIAERTGDATADPNASPNESPNANPDASADTPPGTSADADPAGDPEPGSVEAQLIEAGERIRVVSDRALELFRRNWDRLTPVQQGVVVTGTVVGLVIGVLIGVFLPKRTTAFLTAMAGSGLSLGSAVWLAEASGVGALQSAAAQPARTWLIAWILLGLLGWAAQLTGLARPGKKQDRNNN